MLESGSYSDLFVKGPALDVVSDLLDESFVFAVHHGSLKISSGLLLQPSVQKLIKAIVESPTGK